MINEKELFKFYKQNKKWLSAADWESIAENMKAYVKDLNDITLERIKWNVLYYKKKNNTGHLISIYAILIAAMVAVLAMIMQNLGFLNSEPLKKLYEISTIGFSFFIALYIVILIVPFSFFIGRSLRGPRDQETYYDFYYQIIEEEIDKREKAAEKEEITKHNQDRYEDVMKIHENRSLFKRLSSLFKSK